MLSRNWKPIGGRDGLGGMGGGSVSEWSRVQILPLTLKKKGNVYFITKLELNKGKRTVYKYEIETKTIID